MAGDTPAVADTSSAAEAVDVSLVDDAAPAEAGTPADSAAPAETTTESKPADDKKAGDDGAKDGDADPSLLADDDEGKSPDDADGPADAKKDGAPETYEAFTFPDGVSVDEAALAQATPVFKEIGLNQEQAQKLVTQYAELQQAAAEQQAANFKQVVKDWAAEIKADADFGGDKLPETLGSAKAVLAKYGDANLRNDLKEWGWANHPGLIRLLARVKADLSEDTLVTGDAAAQATTKSVAQRIYPNMPGDNQ